MRQVKQRTDPTCEDLHTSFSCPKRYFGCLRCGICYGYAESHSTPYHSCVCYPNNLHCYEVHGPQSGLYIKQDGTKHWGACSGLHPLCETCWEDLATPGARWPFYEALWMQWIVDGLGNRSNGVDAACVKEQIHIGLFEIETKPIPED